VEEDVGVVGEEAVVEVEAGAADKEEEKEGASEAKKANSTHLSGYQ